MKPKKDPLVTAAELRSRAEAAFRAQAPASPETQTAPTPETTRTLLHELQVHQIELELQNEELRRAQGELEDSRASYFDLYDLAPVGYCTVGGNGIIREANLTLATLLGVARGALVVRLFSSFILKDDEDIFYFLKKKVFAAHPTGADPAAPSCSCELRLKRADGSSLWVNLVVSAATGTDGETVLRVVVTDISARQQAEALLHQREIEHSQILSSVSDQIAVLDARGVIVFVNRAWQQFAAENGAADLATHAVGSNYFGWQANAAGSCDDEATLAMATGLRAVVMGQQEQFELEYRWHSPTEEHWFLLTINRFAASDPGSVLAIKNITARKRAEFALHTTLHEKTALLNEVHHRVKNNLQVVTSLLRLESSRSTVPATKAVLTAMQGRIRAMAQLHEVLYRSGTYASVDLGSYIRQIATQSFRTLNTAPAVRLALDVGHIRVSMDQAAPCGLLVNELLSNCLKHAFPAGRGGEVRIELQPVADSAQVCLRVSDDGIGLPPDFATKRGESLGLQLVGDLSEQLNATLVIGPAPAAIFALTFTPVTLKAPTLEPTLA